MIRSDIERVLCCIQNPPIRNRRLFQHIFPPEQTCRRGFSVGICCKITYFCAIFVKFKSNTRQQCRANLTDFLNVQRTFLPGVGYRKGHISCTFYRLIRRLLCITILISKPDYSILINLNGNSVLTNSCVARIRILFQYIGRISLHGKRMLSICRAKSQTAIIIRSCCMKKLTSPFVI